MAKRGRSGVQRAARRPARRPSAQAGKLQARKPAAPPRQAVATVQPGPRIPAPPPPVLGPPPEAVALFESAMESMQRHAYADAATGFRALMEAFPGERALMERARVYHELCERELRKRPAAPQTVEERLTAATAALNDGDLGRAEHLVQSVLLEDPRQDLALYLQAAIEARRGAADAALSRLREAIALSPDAAAQARFDADFESLFQNETFRALTETRTNHLGPARRNRRPRPER